jgi:hypothetical protein
MKTRCLYSLSFMLLTSLPFRGNAQSVAFSASSATGAPGGSAVVSISLDSSVGVQPAAIEWTLTYPAADISNVTVSTGAAAVAAGKSVTCAPTAGGLICLAYGLNDTAIPNGDFADVSVSLAPASAFGSAAIQIGGTSASSPTGTAIASTASNGVITIAGSSILSSLVCSPATVYTPGSLTCQVTISAVAPSAGFIVAISSNGSGLTLPASLTIPAGSTSASFSGDASPSVTSQVVAITVSSNGVAKVTSVSLSPASFISALSCSPNSLTSHGTASCNVTIAPTALAAVAVSLSNNVAALAVPSSVSVPTGSSTGSFEISAGAVGTSASGAITASLNDRSVSFNLSLITAPILTGLSCNPAIAVIGDATNCTASLNSPALVGGAVVNLSTSLSSVGMPATITVPVGASSAGFSVSLASVHNGGQVSIEASYDASSATFALDVVPLQTQTVNCSPVVVLGGVSAECIVSLNAAAPANGTVVHLTSTNSALTVPKSATVAAGATTATFSVATIPSATDQMAWIAATTFNGLSQSGFALLAAHAPSTQMNLLLRGVASETSGVTAGAIVTPSAALPQTTGVVVVNGAGSVTFVPARDDTGVIFQMCCTNTNNAYYQFSGAQVGEIFNINQGQATFYLTSSYSFAQRQASAALQRYAFDVRDAENHLFYFLTQVTSGYLQFTYMVGGSSQYYFVPQGTENALFGSGVTVKVALTWNGSTTNLYLNDTLVKSNPYVPLAPNWTAASLFDFGAYEYLTFGGYDSSDDAISDFVVTGPTIGGN